MKPKQSSLIKFLTVCVVPVIVGMSTQTAKAVNHYWDENDATAGFGTAGTTLATWSNSTSLFSLDSTGSTAPTGTQLPTNNDVSFFGTNAVGVGLAGGIITVSGNPSMSSPTFGTANTGSIEITGGQLNLGTAAALTITSNALGNKISSVLIGGNSAQILTITGGAMTLSGANTFDRAITINGTGSGKLIVTSVGSVGSTSSNMGAPTTAATATVNMLGGGTLSYTGTGETSDRVLNLSSGSGSGASLEQSGTGLLKLTGGVTSTGTSSKTLTLQGSTAGTAEISGVIANNSVANLTTIQKNGSGTWTFSNTANTYSGKTAINGGTLSVSSIGSVGGGVSGLGSVTTVANGTIDMSGGGRLLYTGAGETTNRVINLLSGFSSGAVLDQSGSGNLNFTGGVTSTGTSSKTITLQGSTAGTGEISGAIADNSVTNLTSITKTGSGTWTLSGANTYTGGTTLQNGTLRIQSSVAGPTTINGTGAVLAGTGIISGDVTLADGAIAPGNGVTPIGTLILNNNLHLSPTQSKFNLDLSSVDNSSDLLTLNALFKGAGTVTFNFSGGVAGQTYTLFQFNSTDLVPADASAFVVTGGTGTFNISSGTTLTYTVQTVAAVGGYSSYASSHGLSANSSQDTDNDGVANGVEYFMNAPTGFTALPPVVNTGGVYSITWSNGGNIPASAYGTQYVVQTSTNLVNWTDVPVGSLTTNTDGPGGQLKYTLTGIGSSFARLVVTPN